MKSTYERRNEENEKVEMRGRRRCDHLVFFNLALVSVAFLALFTAFNTLQNYATSIFPGNLGYDSLAILYLSVCVVVPFAPALVAWAGEQKSMETGAWFYVVWMVSLIHVVPAVVYCTSFVIGAGAAVLWVGQGSFLIKISPAGRRGEFSGVFWSVFQVCNVVGNAVAFFLFKHTSKGALLTAFSACGAVGAAL